MSTTIEKQYSFRSSASFTVPTGMRGYKILCNKGDIAQTFTRSEITAAAKGVFSDHEIKITENFKWGDETFTMIALPIRGNSKSNNPTKRALFLKNLTAILHS